LIEISLGGKLCRCKQIQSLKPENALRPVDNSRFMVCRVGRLPFDATLSVKRARQPEQGAIMAKRKKGSKVQTRAKLRRRNSAKRGKARKVVKSARGKAKRTVASAKPKRASVKKAARKEVAPVVETVAAEVIEQPAPGEIEETRQVS
jgi:hypothetical protein